jgi:hypothetical protein
MLQHAYLTGNWPAARLRYGLLDRTDGSLCGVLVLGVPMHPNVLTRPFPDLEPYVQSLELVRLVVDGGVASNGKLGHSEIGAGTSAGRTATSAGSIGFRSCWSAAQVRCCDG